MKRDDVLELYFGCKNAHTQRHNNGGLERPQKRPIRHKSNHKIRLRHTKKQRHSKNDQHKNNTLKTELLANLSFVF